MFQRLRDIRYSYCYQSSPVRFCSKSLINLSWIKHICSFQPQRGWKHKVPLRTKSVLLTVVGIWCSSQSYWGAMGVLFSGVLDQARARWRISLGCRRPGSEPQKHPFWKEQLQKWWGRIGWICSGSSLVLYCECTYWLAPVSKSDLITDSFFPL